MNVNHKYYSTLFRYWDKKEETKNAFTEDGWFKTGYIVSKWR